METPAIPQPKLKWGQPGKHVRRDPQRLEAVMAASTRAMPAGRTRPSKPSGQDRPLKHFGLLRLRIVTKQHNDNQALLVPNPLLVLEPNKMLRSNTGPISLAPIATSCSQHFARLERHLQLGSKIPIMPCRYVYDICCVSQNCHISPSFFARLLFRLICQLGSVVRCAQKLTL